MRTLVASAAIFALMASPAFATKFCDEQHDVKVGENPIYKTVDDFGPKIVGTTPPGPDGWDGVGGQCTKPGSDRIWVGPRDANGVCLTPASLVGSQGGAIFKIMKIGEHQELDYMEDILEDQYRKGALDKKSYAKAVLIETIKAIIEKRWPNPVPFDPYVNWGDWKKGSC